MATTKTGFLQENFLLQTSLAEKLYFDVASQQPIIDYHSHLSPFEIATNRKYENMTKIWLSEDHYKWRAMRGAGVDERFITGDASDEEKFHAWAKTVPQTVRNPLFHWTYLELKNSFGIEEYLNPGSADRIYTECNALLSGQAHTARKFLEQYNVVYLCSTDDPCDDLRYHHAIKNDLSFKVGVGPSFRPDKAFAIHDTVNFLTYINNLSAASSIDISDMDGLLSALESRIEHFALAGCTVSDHGLSQLPAKRPFSIELENELKTFFATNGKVPFSDPDAFVFHVLTSLCKIYHARGWVQQFHLGAIRNNNSRLKAKLGADAGFDSIGDYSQAERLSAFLNALDSEDKLSKTIIYNLNPANNALFATMCGNFNDGSIKGKVQYGPAWWFLDQKNGMEQHLDILSDVCLLSTFVGMITDSRSLLSFSRHEYFRRILCNLMANDMLNGIVPNDERWMGELLKKICYENAKEYFSI
jgi:glucuronate isomerase